MKKFHGVFLCLMILFHNPLLARRGDIFFHLNDKPYDEARRKIIVSGFEPARVPDRLLLEGCIGFVRCSDYPELVNCIGIGIALCESAFWDRKNGRYIRVMSYGEISKRIDSIYLGSETDLRNWGISSR